MRPLILITFLLSYQLSQAQINEHRTFMFGHSLVNYESASIAIDEGKIAHWIYLFAAADDKLHASTGQFGFLPSHANLPPQPAWGYSQVPAVWDGDTESFAEADFNSILLTAGNFMQWQAADEDYPTDPGVSPLSATQTIFDWVADQEESVNYYIYENWPDMAPFLSAGFPATPEEFETYHDYTLGDFHQWWLDYQDMMLDTRPEFNVRLIPVGPIISMLHREFFPEAIPINELYEDDAPHGLANTYFLAGLVTYMSMYECKASSSFEAPETIHPMIRNNFAELVDFIWDELLEFNLPDGSSRVFVNAQTTATQQIDSVEPSVKISPNPTDGIISVTSKKLITSFYLRDLAGRIVNQGEFSRQYETRINLSTQVQGIYLLELELSDRTVERRKIVIR